MRNPRVVFLLLLIVVAGSIYWVQLKSPQVRTVSGSVSSRSEAVSIDQQAGPLRLDFSGGEQRKFKRPRRNLFGLLYPEPPVAKKVAPAKKLPQVVKKAVVAAPPPPPVPIRSSVQRMPGFQVLGSLEKKSGTTAFVQLQGEIYLLKQGQQFAEKYQVAGLTPERIRIVRLEDGGEVQLPLKDTAGGAAAGSSSPGFAPTGMPAGHPPMNN